LRLDRSVASTAASASTRDSASDAVHRHAGRDHDTERELRRSRSGRTAAGWTSAHGGGANVVPWITSNSFCSNNNAAFHQNANDNGAGDPTRWERLFSPLFAIPADSSYVTLDFDVCTDTEFDPNFNIQAFDGLTLRIFDNTAGFTPRSVLVEAYADEITTGSIKHFPKHLPRNNDPAYLQDMSVWPATRRESSTSTCACQA
jgi:hypothetical protein